MALKEALTGTEQATCDAEGAKTGTPFFGYIIATALANTHFSSFFHNQIASAWLAFLDASFFHIGHDPLRVSALVPSATWRWLLFDFDDKTLARAFAHSAR